MRYTFFSFLALLITLKLSSGFVVPTALTKVNNASYVPPNVPDISYENVLQSNLQNISAINDTEIFLTVEEKASNLSERSLIFINKKLKTLHKIPVKNRYHAYPYFMSEAAQSQKQWVTDEKLQRKFLKEQYPDSVKSIQSQLFEPNKKQKKPLLETLVYRYVYPDMPKRNKSCIYEGHHESQPQSQNIVIQSTHPTFRPDLINSIDVKYNAKQLVKVFDIKSPDLYIRNQIVPTKYHSGLIKDASVAPETHGKNIVIKSYTNRKTKSNSNNQPCGFLKRSWLHRLTFNRNSGEKMDPNDLVSRVDKNSYGDEILGRHIKQALSELQIQIRNSDNEVNDGKENKRSPHQKIENNAIDAAAQKLDELLAEIGGD